MANPLTLFVPIKQDFISQAAAQLAYNNFVSSVQAGLDESGIVHYARVALIPNASGEGTYAILLITTFDGPMNPYLAFFWKNPSTQAAFSGIAKIALNPPSPPVTDLTGFENFINENNLNVSASPGVNSDLYQAYPQTVREIVK
ncbi:hypothetical protein [Pedobacter gandavensis]|uniref:hypothetical protein n=1 Tax=Pedobacter gandavensis TaxID=2679963 RepID=UPI00292DE0D9|nr:hypothetical protein [Pedobacter gandavensis]